ncbi:protein of unknown function [Cupriavidus neocaledonicus]|uniref:Uncharacterized protein n=1 Tax=Cupriavidus neocaledonicus TaxID=1040979 RepID=A0A375H7P2_9BURK|nr:hypothetical protein CBM2605_A80180 [Cupriavidus neocaledonicus]SPD46269.1 protein of unknown function [Cupriavidus neocaledonicus]
MNVTGTASGLRKIKRAGNRKNLSCAPGIFGGRAKKNRLPWQPVFGSGNGWPPAPIIPA